MSLPTKARTWELITSPPVEKPALSGAALIADAYNRKIIVEIVRALVSQVDVFGRWEHVASSNVSNKDAGTNLWTDGTTNNYANLSTGTAISGYTSQPEGGTAVGTPTSSAAGSWIVLKANNFFDTENTNPLYMTIQLGKSGAYGACSIFLSRTEPNTSAATATVRPVPTDGAELTYRPGMLPAVGTPLSATSMFGIGAFGTMPMSGPWSTQATSLLPAQVTVSVIRSAQGFRFFVRTAEVPFFVGAVDYVDGAYASATDFPRVAMFWESGWLVATALTTAMSPITSTKYWKDRRVRMYRADDGAVGVPYECYMTQETYGDGTAPVASTATTNVLSGPNDQTNSYPLFPIGLASTSTGAIGRHGYIADMYWASDRNAPIAAYPSSGAPEWVQVGSILLPWDGTTDL